MRALFGAALHKYDDGQREFRARSGALKIPAELVPWTRAMLGFDQRPQVHKLKALAGNGVGEGLWPTDIASLYGIPLDRDVSGASVGIIALGGGYQQEDLARALQQMGRPLPAVVQHPVGDAHNAFQNGSLADQEIALDLQIVAAMIPTGRITVYFAENTTQSLAKALNEAVFDEVNRPAVLSISWGSMETFWSLQARNAVQAILADAVRLHVTVVAASGDDLATGGALDGQANVFFPASSPYVLACGGTAVTLQNGAITGEQVWNDGFAGSGGGVSEIFPVPDYQANAGVPPSLATGGPGRGVPDVAAAAAQIPGYSIVLNGVRMAKDGTSAATPLWASLIAMANAERGSPMGLVNPSLYADPALCRVIKQGNNRVNGTGYDAGAGWSACTGLGVPKGAEILAALAAPAVA
jgi:kumamolisin